jgi:hypothetical protein
MAVPLVGAVSFSKLATELATGLATELVAMGCC